jgi:hydrogenase expression/formation protein HypC
MVIEIADDPMRMASVDFDGIRRDVSLVLSPETKAGDYVLVHAGFAIQRLDAEEARRLLEMLEYEP